MRRAARLVLGAVALAILAGGSIVGPQVAASTSDPVYQICKTVQFGRGTTSPPLQWNTLSQCCMSAATFSCAPGDTDCIGYDYNWCMMTSQSTAVIKTSNPEETRGRGARDRRSTAPDDPGFVAK
jgi:hypothetical protein